MSMSSAAEEPSDAPAAIAAPVATSEVVVDALPYIDHGYDEPGVREAVSGVEFGLIIYCLGWWVVKMFL